MTLFEACLSPHGPQLSSPSQLRRPASRRKRVTTQSARRPQANEEDCRRITAEIGYLSPNHSTLSRPELIGSIARFFSFHTPKMNALSGFLLLLVVISTRYLIIPSLIGFDSSANLLNYFDVLFNNPFISYKTLKECIFMVENSAYVHTGSNLNQLPLYVKLFSLIPEKFHFYVFCMFDFGSMWFVLQIATNNSKKEAKLSTPVKMLLYLLNPLIYINLLMKTGFVIVQFCIIMTIYHIQKSKSSMNTLMAGGFTALAAYFDIYNLGLSLVLLNFAPAKNPLLIGSFSSILTLLMASSYKMQPTFVANNIISKLLFKEQYPNIGLWWYFFIEIFQEYRDFFKFIFNCYCFIFVVPIFIRFKKYPLQAFVILLTWITLFKPYPSFGELGFILTCFVYWFDLSIIKYKFLMVLLIVHSLILLPVFYHLWITIGSGNSNFFYALTLVYVASLVLILLGMIKSVLYREYEAAYVSAADESDAGQKDEEKKLLNLVFV